MGVASDRIKRKRIEEWFCEVVRAMELRLEERKACTVKTRLETGAE